MFDVAKESLKIMEREGDWSDSPPDPPTKRGVSLPLWNEWCIATGQTFRTGKRALAASTEEDALAFFRWYFQHKGIAELMREFNLPEDKLPLVMDLRTQHSLEGCKKILAFAERAMLGDVQKVVIAAARMRYVLLLADGPQRHLRRDVRGLMHRALKAIGWWGPDAGPEGMEEA